MSADASEQTIVRFTQNNPCVEKSAILASRFAPLTVLQLLRVLEAASHPSRTIFYDTGALVAWLKGSLTPTEVYRLGQFLRERDGDSVATAGTALAELTPTLPPVRGREATTGQRQPIPSARSRYAR
jgi:hypothetical protein